MVKLELLVILVSTIISWNFVESSSISWKKASLSELVLLNLEPSGLDDGPTHLFICRVPFSDTYWTPGKVHLKPDNPANCLIPMAGKEHHFDDFEVGL